MLKRVGVFGTMLAAAAMAFAPATAMAAEHVDRDHGRVEVRGDHRRAEYVAVRHDDRDRWVVRRDWAPAPRVYYTPAPNYYYVPAPVCPR